MRTCRRKGDTMIIAHDCTGYSRKDSMAYGSRVFRILIASPSDVEDEREIDVSVGILC